MLQVDISMKVSIKSVILKIFGCIKSFKKYSEIIMVNSHLLCLKTEEIAKYFRTVIK